MASVEHAANANEAIRSLNHDTLSSSAHNVADVYTILGELAQLGDRLDQPRTNLPASSKPANTTAPWTSLPKTRGTAHRSPSTRPALPSIADRPAIVNERGEAGYWEIDTIIGARNRSGMIWLCERVSRFTIPVTLPAGYAAIETLAGLVEAFETIPTHLRRSVTFDQGSEWAEWETLAATYELDVWFLRAALTVATRPIRTPQPPSPLVVPARHQPRPNRARSRAGGR